MKLKMVGLILTAGITIISSINVLANEANLKLEKYSVIASDYENEYFKRFPEQGLLLGKKNVALDRFSDYSIKSLKQWQVKEDRYLERLEKVELQSIKKSPQQISYLLLKEFLENNKSARICKTELWDVNPMDGFHIEFGSIAEKQNVGSEKFREMALKRWRDFDLVVNSHIENLKIGLKQGYSAPKLVVKRVLNQLDMMILVPIGKSPFYSLAKRDPNIKFKKQITKLIKNKINPALTKYKKFLEKQYLAKARTNVGVWALPNGEKCYQAKIKQQTTLALSPKYIHQAGLNNIKRITSEISSIGLKLYGESDPVKTFNKAKLESVGSFKNETDIINYNKIALAKVKKIAPQWFELMPISKGIIKPYPLHRAKNGAAGEYWPPSNDGKEPGVFFINTYQPKKMSRIDLEATLFHELIPGHHFQIALEYENKTMPSINKYLWNSGYGEGWALYVERLADEMGLYTDDIDRLGMLSNESLRASRLVVDSGMHAFHWTRQQAVDYLSSHTATDKHIIEGEIDRYIMLPAQANSYMIGKMEIESLRDLAKNKLGNKFDIRKFHNQVLKNGTVSLSILRVQIQQWLKNHA